RHHAHVAAARGGCGGYSTRPHHADHWDVGLVADHRQGLGGGRVACHHQELHILAEQPGDARRGKGPNLAGGPWTVRGASVVAEVHGRLFREAAAQLGEDGEAAYSRVEDTDGTPISPDGHRRSGATG